MGSGGIRWDQVCEPRLTLQLRGGYFYIRASICLKSHLHGPCSTVSAREAAVPEKPIFGTHLLAGRASEGIF